MDEFLKNLIESEILTDETKQQITEAFKTHVAEQVELAKEQTAVEVQAKLVEQWVSERETLIQAIDAKIDQIVETELKQFADDVENYRDLKVEYAEKLAESKANMAVELQQDMAVLLKQIDSFLDVRIQEEFDELREDIELAKKDRFGRQIFEAFQDMFATRFVDEDSVSAKLQEAQELNSILTGQLMDIEQVNETLVREGAIDKLLSPLSGRSRDIMESILESAPTPKLSDTYNKFIGRIINEHVNPTTEKEGTVLAEGEKQQAGKLIVEQQYSVKSGNDTNKTASEIVNENTLDPASTAWLRKMSGQTQ